MKFTRPFFLQCSFLLLFGFAGLTDISSLFFATVTKEDKEMIVAESFSDDVEDLNYRNNHEGGDDNNRNDACIFSRPALLLYPLISKAGKQNIHASLHSFISLYLLYRSLIFYHPAPYA